MSARKIAQSIMRQVTADINVIGIRLSVLSFCLYSCHISLFAIDVGTSHGRSSISSTVPTMIETEDEEEEDGKARKRNN